MNVVTNAFGLIGNGPLSVFVAGKMKHGRPYGGLVHVEAVVAIANNPASEVIIAETFTILNIQKRFGTIGSFKYQNVKLINGWKVYECDLRNTLTVEGRLAPRPVSQTLECVVLSQVG